MRFTTRSIARAGITAALYCALTLLLQPISFGAVQFRIAEALTLLPVLTWSAVPGLAVGCLLANMLGGAVWFDVVFGTLATLLAAVCTRVLRDRLPLAAAMPVLFNGLIVGPVVYFGYVKAPADAIAWPVLFSTIGTVAFGEAVVCFILGVGLITLLKRAPESLWED